MTEKFLEEFIENLNISSVIHFAALKAVGESITAFKLLPKQCFRFDYIT